MEGLGGYRGCKPHNVRLQLKKAENPTCPHLRRLHQSSSTILIAIMIQFSRIMMHKGNYTDAL